MNTLRHWWMPLLLCLASLGSVASAWAADPQAKAGVVKHVSGGVTLQRGAGAAPQALTLGQTVLVGDVIRTAANGMTAVTLMDDTALTAGPNSELVLSEFSFDSTTQAGGMLISLWRGTLAVISGLIAGKTPEKVNVQTRTVVLGVRGTEFIVDAGAVTQ